MWQRDPTVPLNLKISRQIKGVLQVTSQSFRDLKVGSFINALDVVMCAVERTMRSGAEKSPAQPCLVCCHAVPAFTVRNCSRKKLMSLELIKFPEANSSPTEQGWLEDDRFSFWVFGLFSGISNGQGHGALWVWFCKWCAQALALLRDSRHMKSEYKLTTRIYIIRYIYIDNYTIQIII